MKDASDLNFGLLIAFLLPGFLLLWGASFSVPEVKTWLADSNSTATSPPTVGSFLYATLASLALGLVISALRGVFLDTFLYRFTRLDRPNISYETNKDPNTLAAYQAAIENHYRYYQYYAHSLIAITAAFLLYLIFGRISVSLIGWGIAVAIILTLGYAARKELKSFNECVAEFMKYDEPEGRRAT